MFLKQFLSTLILCCLAVQSCCGQNKQATLDSLQAAMGTLPELSGLPPMDPQYRDTLATTAYTRYTINLTVANKEILPVYLYIPTNKPSTDKYPTMLVLHSTGSLGKAIVDGQGDTPNRAYAKELAERGYVVIAPDYPSFGELENYDFEHDRYESGTMKGIFNHIRCVDFLETIEQVDTERMGVIGHSLGGHNAMFTAAFDERLKVIVSSCGWTQLEFYDTGGTGEKLAPWAQDKYMPLLKTKYRLKQEKVPFNFHEIIRSFAPRRFISNSPIKDGNFDVKGVEEGIKKAETAYESLGVKEKLHVFYPNAGHDFPLSVRLEVYQLIDDEFKHTLPPKN